MKKKKVLLCIAVVLILCLFIFLSNALFGSKISYNMEEYTFLTESKDFLPEIKELGSYNDLYFQYYHDDMLIFESDAYVLKVYYDEENYCKEKEKLNYVYQTEPLRYSDRETSKASQFNFDTFDFNVLSVQEYDLFYPKELVFVGTSDDNNAIAYVYFYDFDLDYIDGSFEEFLKNECKW